MRFFVGTLVVRALLSVPAHAIWAGFVGHYAARRRFDGKGPGWLGSYAIAVIGHGLFDAALFAAPVLRDLHAPAASTLLLVFPIVEVIAGFLILRRLALRDLADDDAESLARRP